MGDYAVAETSAPSGSAWVENTLHSFQGQPSDGAYPYAGVIFDSSGNLYGATTYGGTTDGGIVFQLVPSSGWTYTPIFEFGGPNAGGEYGNLAIDNSGNLYTATAEAGPYGRGQVIELTPSNRGWTQNLWWNFTGGADGGVLFGGVNLDASGNVYGTTFLGGAYNDGVVFEMTP